MLEVRNLTVAYDLIHAVQGVSIAAEQGVITTIIGSNGAGKTTLLKAISGILRPRGGEVYFLGKRIDGLSTSQIVGAGISQVPEGRELFPRMSVYDNLMVGAYLRRDSKKTITRDLDNIYELFPVLKRKVTHLARELSGGEQQMLAFGRALMSSPKMLLLDEPSIGLAPVIEQSLMETIEALARDRGIGVVLVEQNASVALRVARWGYVLDLGRMVLQGATAELTNNPGVRAAYLGL